MAYVDANGNITGVQNGEATITAKNQSGMTATCKVRVVNSVKLKGINFASSEMTMRNLSSEILEVNFNPADTTDDKTATWTSSNEKVVTVTQNGMVTALGEGEATVSVNVQNYSASIKIIVEKAATLKEMLMRKKFNLAYQKRCEIYPGIYEGDTSYITDGVMSAGGEHAALGTGWGYEDASYVCIDLGDYYDAQSIKITNTLFI